MDLELFPVSSVDLSASVINLFRFLRRSLKPSLMPQLEECESLACRIIDLAPSGVKFLKDVTFEVPHFASLRNGERELVVLSTNDGGNNWKEMAVESGSGKKKKRTNFNVDFMLYIKNMLVCKYFCL